MDLTVIIVNYKTADLVMDCLGTIDAETDGIDYEVIVVDNASGDNSREVVQQVYPSVRWIQMSYNAGFARANNEGIRQSSGGIVLLLNSDTIVENKAIAACYASFAASAYVACGVQLLNPDRTPQISGNYFVRGALNNLLPLPFVGSWVKKAGSLFKVRVPNVPNADSLVDVDWINGAFMMVKRATIEEAGLMDEDFFLYAEEIEWCSRLRKLGPLCIYGQFHVIHLQGATANETFGSEGKGYYNLYDRKGLQIMLSNFVRIRKQFGAGWFLVHLFFYVVEIPIFGAGLLVSSLARSDHRRYSYRQFRQYCANIARVIARAGTIIRNKPYFYKVL